MRAMEVLPILKEKVAFLSGECVCVCDIVKHELKATYTALNCADVQFLSLCRTQASTHANKHIHGQYRNINKPFTLKKKKNDQNSWGHTETQALNPGPFFTLALITH